MTDTSPEAVSIQAGIHRRLTGAQRLALAFELSEMVRELCLARLRREHPDWSDRELKRELLRYAFLPGAPPAPLR